MQITKVINEYLLSTGGLMVTFDAIAVNTLGGLNLKKGRRYKGSIDADAKNVFLNELKAAECVL